MVGQNVVHYRTTVDNVKYLFATAELVSWLKSGDILDTNTLDCFGKHDPEAGRYVEHGYGDNPLAGPFYVEGAEPGDTLVVNILDWQVDGDTGGRVCGEIWRDQRNQRLHACMLHPPLPEKIWYYHIDHVANTATFKALDSDFSVKISTHPFFGCIVKRELRPRARHAVRWCRMRSLAGTWILRKRAWATPCIFR